MSRKKSIKTNKQEIDKRIDRIIRIGSRIEKAIPLIQKREERDAARAKRGHVITYKSSGEKLGDNIVDLFNMQQQKQLMYRTLRFYGSQSEYLDINKYQQVMNRIRNTNLRAIKTKAERSKVVESLIDDIWLATAQRVPKGKKDKLIDLYGGRGVNLMPASQLMTKAGTLRKRFKVPEAPEKQSREYITDNTYNADKAMYTIIKQLDERDLLDDPAFLEGVPEYIMSAIGVLQQYTSINLKKYMFESVDEDDVMTETGFTYYNIKTTPVFQDAVEKYKNKKVPKRFDRWFRKLRNVL